MSEPLVSVVLPCYNHEAFVVEALTSVIAQDHPELELIAVDDASTDRTAALLGRTLSSEHFCRRLRRIVKVFRTRNEGAHSALNEGIRHARGKYVALLTSDDLYAPQRISAAVRELSRTQSRVAFTAVRAVDVLGQPTSHSLLARQLATWPDWVCSNLPTIGFGFLRYQWTASTGNLVFERDLHAEVGGFTSLRYCHDWDFILKCILRTEPIFIPAALYKYRIHGANSFSTLTHLADIESREVLRRFLKLSARAPVPNALAPTARNWPGTFEYFSDLLGLAAIAGEVARERPRYSRSGDDPREHAV